METNLMYFDIEIQVSKDADLIERILYYWARMYARQIKAGGLTTTIKYVLIKLYYITKMVFTFKGKKVKMEVY